ncbi:hypothetical protein MBLNU230_g3448t1 [Neophaeotheca triangularis]
MNVAALTNAVGGIGRMVLNAQITGLFRVLTSREAKSLLNAFYSNPMYAPNNDYESNGWRPSDFVMCKNKCESFEMDLSTTALQLPWSGINMKFARAPGLPFGKECPWEVAGPWDGMCENQSVSAPNRASLQPNWAGTLSAVNEISDCREDPNFPDPGLHTTPETGGTLVCVPCKRIRAIRYEWRLEGLLQGVCRTCYLWAVVNQPVVRPGEAQCGCGPQPWRPANPPTRHAKQSSVGPLPPFGPPGPNNAILGEPRHYHMCRAHIMAYTQRSTVPGGLEDLNRRRTRIVKNTKKKNPYAKKRPVRTPEQRRRATRIDLTVPLELDPRCYCGAKMSLANHSRIGVLDRVRNCVGCNQFVRRW